MSENKADPLREALERLAASIDTRINDLLCETKPNYDDSIVGINDAWDVVRKACKEYIARAALAAPQPAAPLGGREAPCLNAADAILAAIPQERGVEREAREECLRRGIDPDDICADGGVTAWMVVDQETREGRRHPIEILWREQGDGAMKLTKENRALLEPYAKIFEGISDEIFKMPDDDLAKLSAAIDTVSSTNCNCLIYDAAKYLREQIADVRRIRAARQAEVSQEDERK